MRLEARRIDGFLQNPGATRVVLLHGEDAGLIRERGAVLIRSVAGSTDDPFRIVELDRDAVGTISDEMASLALTGGRRVVHLRDAGDFATDPVRLALAGTGQGLVILEAVGLPARSRLRTLIEAEADAVAIPCYPDEGRNLAPTIRTTLNQDGVDIDDDALTWLVSQLGVDRGVTRREIEKLALYVGRGNRVRLADAEACVGDLAGLSLDDALFAATNGHLAAADRALELALSEGAMPVQIVRAALGHMQRLHYGRLGMERGLSASEAANAIRPPIFFRRTAAFIQALSAWSLTALEAATGRLSEAERACKRTGSPAETISRNVVLGLAQRAAVESRR